MSHRKHNGQPNPNHPNRRPLLNIPLPVGAAPLADMSSLEIVGNTCGNCRHWKRLPYEAQQRQPNGIVDIDKIQGQCRAGPPQVVNIIKPLPNGQIANEMMNVYPQMVRAFHACDLYDDGQTAPGSQSAPQSQIPSDGAAPAASGEEGAS